MYILKSYKIKNSIVPVGFSLKALTLCMYVSFYHHALLLDKCLPGMRIKQI